jgi:hypothetical protein
VRKKSGCNARIQSVDEGKGLVPKIIGRGKLGTGEGLVTEKDMVMALLIRTMSLSKDVTKGN